MMIAPMGSTGYSASTPVSRMSKGPTPACSPVVSLPKLCCRMRLRRWRSGAISVSCVATCSCLISISLPRRPSSTLTEGRRSSAERTSDWLAALALSACSSSNCRSRAACSSSALAT